jgi:uncharacterized membrane protein
VRWSRRFLRQLRVRPRLVLATGVCLLLPPLLPASLTASTRALVAWDLGAGLYVALAWTMMLRASVEKMRWRARVEDDGAAAVLVLTLVAAVASVAAIVLELVGCRNLPVASQTPHLVLAGTTILTSWCFVHTAFAIHYAHEFYVERGGPHRRGLEYPGPEPPDYVDFLYFSFVIGSTSQTADVSIASRTMRRLALLHGIVAFLFNTTLLALTVNIAASLV